MADSVGYYNWAVKIIPPHGNSYNLLTPYWAIENKIIEKYERAHYARRFDGV